MKRPAEPVNAMVGSELGEERSGGYGPCGPGSTTVVSGTTSEASEERTPRVRLRAEALVETAEAAIVADALLPLAAVVVFAVEAAAAEAGAAQRRRRTTEERRARREAGSPGERPFDLDAPELPDASEGREEASSRSMWEGGALRAAAGGKKGRNEEEKRRR